jgi:hypothetical protein
MAVASLEYGMNCGRYSLCLGVGTRRRGTATAIETLNELKMGPRGSASWKCLRGGFWVGAKDRSGSKSDLSALPD